MTELERQLTQLGRSVDWPATPDIATPVRRRLAEAPVRPRLFRRTLAIALASLLVLAGGVLAAVPDVRDSVLEFFGLRGVTVERRERLPVLPEARPLELGQRTTLPNARGSLSFEPLVPRAAGRPAGVFVNSGPPGGAISLVYRARPGLPEASSTGFGLLVGEFRGDLAPELLGKIAGQATLIERFRLDGERAIWIEGAPHVFFYRAPGGGFSDEGLRLAENVLLLERGDLLVRLEGAFGRNRAIELARSLR
jgi:hypothetical protein